jgi:uncharacterized repeat protein (TIGR03803 family)
MRAKSILTLITLILLICAVSLAGAATHKVLYTFTGGLDGGQPYAGLIQDAAGNLYGVTESGGAFNYGTVFKLTRSQNGWTETVLYSFSGGSDGGDPSGGLTLDAAGNLYGTTDWGGDPSMGCGVVFQLSPSGENWLYTVLHTFTSGKDGCGPIANISPSFSGTTTSGGTYNQGTYFRLFPYSVVVSFSRNNGNAPFGTVNQWSYGTTSFGGINGVGNVWENPWGHTVKAIHVFNKTNKFGWDPMGDLLLDKNPPYSMYGTNCYGGVDTTGTIHKGTVYKLTMSQTKYDVWPISLIYTFSGTNGDCPGAGVIEDGSGNLYGTTTWGGADPGYAGTVFKLSPSIGPRGKVIWTLITLHNFSGGADGGEVYSGVILDTAGNLYGTTLRGGIYGQGVVYQIVP